MLNREDPRDWLQISQEWEASGLSQKEYCASRQISRSLFTKSRSQLISKGLVTPFCKRAECEPAEGMRFVAIGLPETAPAFIEIKLPHGIVMKIPTC